MVDIDIHGNQISSYYRKEYKKVLGYLSHQTFLYDNLTAQENLNFFAGIYNIENKKERIDELMDNFGVYDSRNLLVGAFSRGMAQRLSLAKVFLNDPKILLLDEPFTGLDPNALENISGILYKLKSPDRTILVVTHEIDDTVEIADRFAILKDGENVYSGSFYSKDDLKRAYFEHTAR
ncbi:MAG: ABC transporter ATP-binding protein [Acidobacteria bacterium]|nr:ABC transporter ATP-binding protein [Acidobacteriota bacterium]